MKRLPLIAIILAAVALVGEAFIFASRRGDDDDIRREAIRADYRVYAPPLPDSLTFCGERVPLDDYVVREALDREVVTNMYYQSSTLLILKRSTRFFPTIERILRQEGVPDDMKYLCVIESGLQHVTSPAGASGYWQFMKATGQRYGLEINDEVDMRAHLEASTHAACRYLKDLRRRFGGWTEAAAAYNMGKNGLEKRLNQQRQRSYYQLLLNRETTRYVHRILALKLIMENPEDYGYHLRSCDRYADVACREVTLEGRDVDLVQFAIDNGTTYKSLRTLNPWLTSATLKNKEGKRYKLKIKS